MGSSLCGLSVSSTKIASSLILFENSSRSARYNDLENKKLNYAIII